MYSLIRTRVNDFNEIERGATIVKVNDYSIVILLRNVEGDSFAKKKNRMQRCCC